MSYRPAEPDDDTRAAQAYRDYIDALQNGEEELAVQKCREWLDLQLESAA